MPKGKLSRREVDNALRQITPGSVPPNRRSDKYCLIHQGKHYPSKYVVRLAYELKGEDPKGVFRGGKPVLTVLEGLGYEIAKRGGHLPECQDWCLAGH
jgi:hypothetical protein